MALSSLNFKSFEGAELSEIQGFGSFIENMKNEKGDLNRPPFRVRDKKGS